MKIYLSGPWDGRAQLRGYRNELTQVGYRVRASWLDEPEDAAPATAAHTDLADLRAADLLVAFTPHALGLDPADVAHHSGGRHIEAGYALARHCPVVLVGSPENIFHRLPTVTVVPDWHTAILYLSRTLLDWNRAQPRAAEEPETLRAVVRS